MRLFFRNAKFRVQIQYNVSVGLYGVTAFAVARRTREIGIRIALGATPKSVLRMVMLEVLALTIIGAAVGLALALLLSRYIEGQLYELHARDPLVAAATAAIIAVSAPRAISPHAAPPA